MTTPLLATKLYIPFPRSGLVSRPRLIDQLNAGLDRKLTLISAPAGFGKTTLLSEWIHRRGGVTPPLPAPPPVAWVSLDKGDNDPTRFLTYCVAALQTAQAGLGGPALTMLQSPQPPPIEVVLTALINEIAALAGKIILVLDDYHVISNQAIHEGVAFLLDHQPPQLHLTLSTRADPSLPIGRLRVRSQLTELRADDLRFTADEAAAFMNEMMGLNLQPEDIKALEARTEGWIAGLHLAALSLQDRADVHEFITAFAGSHHYVLEYLTEEVLNRQPDQIRQFLLQTSILDRLCGSLCDMVTQQSGGDTTLAYLRRSNLFVVPLDDDYHWHRYHHLFADLLGNYLRKEFASDQISELHRRASQWHEKNELADDAIKYALRAEDFERAADLIERGIPTSTTDLQMTTGLAWVRMLPDDLVRSRPLLCTIQGSNAFFTGQMDDVEPWLQAAESSILNADKVSVVEKEYVLGNVATIRALAADRSGDVSRAIEQARLADAILPQDDVIARSVIPYVLGRACRAEGDMASADQACDDMVRIGRAAGNILTVAMGLCEQALLRKIQGRLRAAAALYQEALQLASGRKDQSLPLASLVDVGLSDLLYEQNDLDAARQSAQRAVDSFEQMGLWGMPTDLVLAYTTLARVLQAQGDVAGASDVLQRAEQAKRQRNVFPEFSSMVDTCRIRLWLAQVANDPNHLADAVRWAESQPTESGPLLTREQERIALARVRIAQGKPDEVLSLLEQLAKSAEDGGRGGRLIEILALQAIALQAQNDTDRALAVLEKSLVLAEPEGYVRIFVDEGAPMGSLISALRSRIEKRTRRADSPESHRLLVYAHKLLVKFPSTKDRPSPIQNLIDPLTERELQVLELICQGCSNREIADTLVVTLNTVKKHTGNIYGKLRVRSRTQAIARSQELGIGPFS
ncbi:MAG: hypothetical protein GY832_28275 [Chloroflexi bacterium]|nr:hypothetical protein [Chloroflexota bacterium]